MRTDDRGAGRRARLLAAALLACCVAALSLAAATASASTLITSFAAGVLKDENVAKPETKDYATQAASHPEIAFTKFTLNTSLGSAKEVRVDLPAGLSVNPQATPQCKEATTSACATATRVGTATVTIANVPLLGKQTVSGAVYNMVPPAGSPSDFGFEVTVAGLITVRTDLVGGLRYYKQNGQPGDYGEYFTISNISNLLGTALETSELVFWGDPAKHNGGKGAENAFLTNPTTCLGPQTTYLAAETYEGAKESTSYTTPVGANGCEAVPFKPTLAVTPATSKRDTPDGLSVDLHVPQSIAAAELASAHVREASLTLPAGLTLNPAAASGLVACKDSEFVVEEKTVKCPAASEVGTVEITTPVLPTPLAGSVYVGQPLEGEPYRVFIDAEDAAAGVAVRLKGTVHANAATGQLTTTFAGDPQLPFSDLKLFFKTGAGALFANPLACGPATTTSVLVPYTGMAPAAPSSAFTVDLNGSGGACPGVTPFAPAASATPTTTTAGAATTLQLALARADGEQLLEAVALKLPEGMVANLKEVTLCGEPAAAQGTCPAKSRIGAVTVTAGAGSAPLSLPGNVYLTHAYKGATFGLSIVVPAIAGPYNLGTVVVRAAVALDTAHGIVTISSDPLPTILQGIPLRLKSLDVQVNEPAGFLLNPASCTASAFTGTVTSVAAQTQPFTDAFTPSGCGSLGFAPKLEVGPATLPRDGAAPLAFKLELPEHSADVRSATLQLPPGLTLDPAVAAGLQACTDAQLGIGTNAPVACPAASAIGTARIVTPLLAAPLAGTLYVGQPFSNDPESGEYRLFLAAEEPADGVSVRLAGAVAADSHSGQLSVTFAEAPPLPFTSLELTLQGGAHAALAAPPECGSVAVAGEVTSSTGTKVPVSATTSVAEGGSPSCGTPLFALTQSTQDATGPEPSYTLTLERPEAQQYLSSVRAALPPGMIGRIASVAQCTEAQAQAGACPASSLIGSAAVAAGSGPAPYALTGSVYLTGPYAGAPYGLAVEVPAESVGPFDFGTIVTRARITVDEHTARVTVSSDPLPTIVGGVPLRLRRLAITAGHGSFLVNPTSCATTAAETTLTSTAGATQSLATPFRRTGCEALPFGATVTASVGGQPTRADGTSLHVELSYPHEGDANVAAVATTLPVQLPSRLTTLQRACPEATFAAAPGGCPVGAEVGQASVTTPVLPTPMSGPVYLVAEPGGQFPALAVLLTGDGLHLALRGQTHIAAGITSATFSGLPDVPFSRFAMTFPQGPHSILAANGALCGETLVMASTLTAQNGRTATSDVHMSVEGCPGGDGAGGAGGLLSRLRISPAHFTAASSGASVSRAPTPPRGHRHRRFRATGTTVTYVDAAAGTSTLIVSRPLRGERRGRSCAAPSPGRRRNGRACTRYRRLGAFTHVDVAGTDALHFTGRLGARKLAPGAYRLEILAPGAHVVALAAGFWIKRG